MELYQLLLRINRIRENVQDVEENEDEHRRKRPKKEKRNGGHVPKDVEIVGAGLAKQKSL
jgi:hypothetical protein